MSDPDKPGIYPWQLQQWDYLIKRWKQDQLPHALLLTGHLGLGKSRFADLFAKRLLCAQHHSVELPCDVCKSCQFIESQSHPDFYKLSPESSSGIRVEQVRELITSLNQTSQQGGYKIVLLSPAESMNMAAANALLKTLEEPAPKTLWMLVCHRPALLPATIKSRCQAVAFRTPPSEQAQQWLSEQPENVSDPHLLLELAEGSPLNALSLNEIAHQRLKFFQDLEILGKKRTNPIEFAEHWMATDPHQVFNWLYSVVVDILRIKSHASEVIVNKDIYPFLENLAAKTSKGDLFDYAERLREFRKALDNRINLNIQLMFENLFIHWIAR